jgi:hypothetical protein
MEQEIQEMEALVKQRALAIAIAPNLFVINLPAGDNPAFNIDFHQSGHNPLVYDSNVWISQGFDGVLFKGAGRGVTRIIPQNADETIFVRQHNGIVAFQDLSIHYKSRFGRGKAVHMGFENPSGPVFEKFALHLTRCSVDEVGTLNVDNGVWGLFGYQFDGVLEDVIFNMTNSHEHGAYWHGFSKNGVSVNKLVVNGVGAECLKFTARPHECRWVKNALIKVTNSVFKNWANPVTSWRGGAGFTSQGSSANVWIENCRYYGGNTMDRAHCIMFDDSGLDFYGAVDGVPGVGPANGHLFIKNTGCALNGISDPWNNNISWIGNLNPSRPPPIISARSLLVDNCGYYGQNTLWNVSGKNGDLVGGRGQFSNCNTPQIRQLMANLGFRVDTETMIAGPTGLVPMSRGLTF